MIGKQGEDTRLALGAIDIDQRIIQVGVGRAHRTTGLSREVLILAIVTLHTSGGANLILEFAHLAWRTR
jgi:hypothetical protein